MRAVAPPEWGCTPPASSPCSHPCRSFLRAAECVAACGMCTDTTQSEAQSRARCLCTGGASSAGRGPACSGCESIMAEESALSWMEALSIRILTATCRGWCMEAWPASCGLLPSHRGALKPGC